MASNKREITKAEAGKEVVAEVKKAVEAKVKKERVKMTPPPPPMVKLGDIPNPILVKKGLKRALAVAIARACSHTRDGVTKINEEMASRMIRTSGILFKAGWSEEAHTDPLTQSEWTGSPYLRFVTSTPEGKVYHEKFPEKLKECVPFAKALKSAVDKAMEKATEKAPETAPATPEVVAPPVAPTPSTEAAVTAPATV